MEIGTEIILDTVKNPDKVFDCQSCGNCYYIKKHENNKELIVMAQSNEFNEMKIMCFGWLKDMTQESQGAEQ